MKLHSCIDINEGNCHTQEPLPYTFFNKGYCTLFFMPPVGWHIAVELSVCLSVCPSENFNIGHYFCNIEDSNLIFGINVYLMELHILNGDRSRSSFKVKGQENKKKLKKCFKAAQ